MGNPEFILAIIGMVLFAGVMRTAVRAKHGLSDPHPGRRGRRAGNEEIIRLQDENAGLRAENTRLSGRLESYEDRLIVLERIVTDRGYSVAAEIEALRDRSDSTERLAAPRKSEERI